MFRKGPQAFVTLPSDTANAALDNAIRDTLEQHGVRTIVAGGSLETPAVSNDMREADFVIADITGTRPNIMIEVGMALGLGKRVLLLSQDRLKELPLDLAARQVAVYRPDEVDSVRKYLDLWLRDALSDREPA